MKYTNLGQAGLKVSRIGIGTEHLNRCSQKLITDVVSCAVDLGYSYFDILTAKDEARAKFGKAFNGRRNKLVIAGHLVRSERQPSRALAAFENLLRFLDTDHVDMLFIQWVDKQNEYKEMMQAEGLYALAVKLREQGKTRVIGMSCHRVETTILAAQGGHFEVLMHPVNLASRAISTPFRRGFVDSEKKAALSSCVEHGVQVVAMKVFWGGRLLIPGNGFMATPVQCLQYALKQPGVEIALGGVASVKEVKALHAFWTASDEEKDFSPIISAQEKEEKVVEGCVYCNHCLPCPQDLDIAWVNRLGDIAERRITSQLRQEYKDLSAHASDCVECGDCTERCPFGVDVVSKMYRTKELLES